MHCLAVGSLGAPGGLEPGYLHGDVHRDLVGVFHNCEKNTDAYDSA